MPRITFDNMFPDKGETISRHDDGKKIAVVQFTDGTEVTTPVETEAAAKMIVMAAFKRHGNKVKGGFCATRV